MAIRKFFTRRQNETDEFYLKPNPAGGEIYDVLAVFRPQNGYQGVGHVERAHHELDQQFFRVHVEQFGADDDFRHNAAQRPQVQTVVRVSPEAHLGGPVRYGLHFRTVHGVRVPDVKRPAEIDNLHQMVVPDTRAKHYVVRLQIGVYDSHALETRQTLYRRHSEK